MANLEAMKKSIFDGDYDPVLEELYGRDNNAVDKQKTRYLTLIQKFETLFPDVKEARIFSTPGRTEIGGNHTDHNGGHILAAAVDMDVLAVVSAADNDDKITIHSIGYPVFKIQLSDLAYNREENYTSVSLIKGVCFKMKELGYRVGGFKAVITSDVLKGSGLSSSAAFEVEIVHILNCLYNHGKLTPIEIAKIAQYAENKFFGKPCGLMDMTACAAGGFVMVDFKDFKFPSIKKVSLSFEHYGYTMLIVDTGGDHSNLNEDYEAIETEMKSVARFFGKSVLIDINKDQVVTSVGELRRNVGDRAVLRAIHFFDDDDRVLKMTEAIASEDIKAFLNNIQLSGDSSWKLCQNCYSSRMVHHQGIPVALEISRYLLNGDGAFRVHGGGFAGTVQIIVPLTKKDFFIEEIKKIFGQSSVFPIRVREAGCVELFV